MVCFAFLILSAALALSLFVKVFVLAVAWLHRGFLRPPISRNYRFVSPASHDDDDN